MNILVTGGAGFIGTRLSQLLAENSTVFPLVHDKTPTDWGTPLSRVRGDVTDFARVLEIIVNCEIDQIYHLAAKSIVRNCRCDPLGCFDTNVMGTATVLEAARQSERIKGIVVMESDKAYGPGPVPYKETQLLQPEGIYEASKACVSHLVRSYYKNYGLPVFSIRSANVYGPGDRNQTRLIPNTITRILRGERPQVVDGAACYVREFIYINDLCLAMKSLMDIGPWGEPINVGSGKTCTVGTLVNRICTLMGVDVAVEQEPRPSTFTEIHSQSLCLDKLHSLLPDFLPTDLDDGLKQTIDWYGSSHAT